MTAKAHVVGKSAHAAEKQAQAFLIRVLPEDYTVYLNSWLAERSGAIYELDAVVVAPHAVFVVEIKSYRGRVEGTDHDWFVPQPIRSPLRTNRLTAQMLKSALKRESAAGAGPGWKATSFSRIPTMSGSRALAVGAASIRARRSSMRCWIQST